MSECTFGGLLGKEAHLCSTEIALACSTMTCNAVIHRNHCGALDSMLHEKRHDKACRGGLMELITPVHLGFLVPSLPLVEYSSTAYAI